MQLEERKSYDFEKGLMQWSSVPLAALIVMPLWNWLIPVLFGFMSLTYLQALALVIICTLLFKGE